MDFLYSAMSIWMLIVWIVGAIVITAGLVLLVLSIYDRLSSKWAKALVSHISTQFWLYQAMRAWEKDGNKRPKKLELMEDQEAIKHLLRKLIVMAMEQGYVITVENKPRTPLAMGNSYMDYDVRPARHRQQEQEGSAK